MFLVVVLSNKTCFAKSGIFSKFISQTILLKVSVFLLYILLNTYCFKNNTNQMDVTAEKCLNQMLNSHKFFAVLKNILKKRKNSSKEFLLHSKHPRPIEGFILMLLQTSIWTVYSAEVRWCHLIGASNFEVNPQHSVCVWVFVLSSILEDLDVTLTRTT